MDVVTGGTGKVLKRVQSEASNLQSKGIICWTADESMVRDYAEYFEPYVSAEKDEVLEKYKNVTEVSALAFCDPSCDIKSNSAEEEMLR